MPPSVVLEVLRITESEMDLRTLTRSTEMARSALKPKAYDAEVKPLDVRQKSLADRTHVVTQTIRDLPEGKKDFAKEIAALENAEGAMKEALARLKRPDTGPVAIAAESEALEYLLQSSRAGKGGGGGSTPGGGGGQSGQTNASALALAGRGLAKKSDQVVRDVARGNRKTKDEVPPELRAALDRYFGGLDSK